MSTISPTLNIQNQSLITFISHLLGPFDFGFYEPVRLQVRVQGDHALLAEVAAEGILFRR